MVNEEKILSMLEAMQKGMNGRFDGIEASQKAMGERFDGLEAAQKAMGERFDGLEALQKATNDRLDRLEEKVDAIFEQTATLTEYKTVTNAEITDLWAVVRQNSFEITKLKSAK